MIGRPGCGGSLLRGFGGLLGFRWFFGLLFADQPFPFRLAADAVGLLLDHAGRMALDIDAQRQGEVKALFVGEAELFGEFIDACTFCHGFAVLFPWWVR